jgi:hypothetical protein
MEASDDSFKDTIRFIAMVWRRIHSNCVDDGIATVSSFGNDLLM